MGSRPLLGRVPALSVAWASPDMLSGQLDLSFSGASQGGIWCYVQNSLACYVLCKFLLTLLCEIKIGCYAEV